MLIFEATFLALAFANAFGYALIAARARNVVRNPKAIRIFNRTGGTLLVGAGIATVAMRSVIRSGPFDRDPEPRLRITVCVTT